MVGYLMSSLLLFAQRPNAAFSFPSPPSLLAFFPPSPPPSLPQPDALDPAARARAAEKEGEVREESEEDSDSDEEGGKERAPAELVRRLQVGR